MTHLGERPGYGQGALPFSPIPPPCGFALWDPDLSGRKSWRYSPECVEVEFSEVHGSKQPLRRSVKHSTTACWHPFSVETLQLGSSSCTVVYQGVATRNIPTTREICLKDETFRSPRRPCEAVHQGHKNVTVL